MKASEDGAIRDERAKGAEATAVKNTRKRLRSAFSYLNLLRAVNPGVLDYVLLLVGVFSSIAAGVPFPLMAIVIGQLVDQLNSASCSSETVSDSYDSSLVNRVLLTVYIAIANFALIYIASGAWSLFGERLVRRLRYAYLYVLLQQEIEFFETLSTGDVASRLDTDLLTIQAGVSEKVGIVLQSVSYFVTAYIVAFIRDAKLAGILFSLVPAYIIMAAAGNHFSAKYRAAVDEKMAPAISLASESLSHIKLIKSFRAGWRIERIFDGYLAATRPAAIGMVVTAAVQMGLLYFIAYSANALAFSQGGNQIADAMQQNDASVTLGAVYAIMTTLIDSSYIISQVAPFLTIFAAASQTGERILDTIHRKPSIDATTGAGGVMMETIEGNIEFKDIFFRYPSRPEMIVLNKLNLHIAVGKMTGIVGLSGSGKSTIAALIQRFYDPGEGVVAIDGHDLRDINLRSLRGHIGYVEQNPVLFDRSILENIAHGLVGSSRPEHRALQRCLTNGDLPELADAVRKGGDITQLAMQSAELDHTLSLIRASATQAGLDSFIAGFPHGLATSVGPSGSRLSGGQRQRVALARTLIRNPSILILDEATAALDSTTEAQIREAIESLPGQRTIVCIAHRLSTIKNAHNIVVMRAGGQIIETGSYQDLMNLDGTFASMVRSQAISGQVEGDAITALGTSETPKCKLVEDEPKVGQSETSETSSTGDDGVPHSSQRSDKAEKSNLFPIFLRIVKMSRSQILIAIGFFSAIVVGGSHAGEAVIFANAVGQLAPCYTASQIRSSASFYGLLFFVLALVEFFANTLTASSFGRVSDQLVIKIRSLTLRALLRRGVQWHESNNRTPGSLMKYVSADAAAMSGLTGTILGVTVSVLVTLVAGIILAHVATWKIALVLTACVPLIFVSGFLRLRLQARFAERHAKAFADSVATATESVTHIRTVSAFALQEEVASTFNRSLRGPYRATLKSIAFGNVWLAASFSIGSFVKALAFWWGGRLIANKEISQIQYFIAEVALLSAAQTSGQLFSLSPDVTKAVVAARQVFDLICPDGKTERLQGEHQQPPKTDIEKSAGVRTPMNLPQMTNRDIGTSVSFSNVRFSYPSRPDTVILQDITLDIPAGSFVAIVGTTGAGKSTIMSLLQKLYRPTSGTITLDGYNITRGGTQQKESEEEEDEQENDIPIWDDVALVPQDAALFSGSVAFNIGLGARANSDATESEIEAAARLANIHDTIKSLPDGYETLCGPTGSQFFSGGQKQRLCIARALLRKPRLLLLDEPSSAMDAESEGLWERTLEDLMEVGENGQRRVTVVAIAHRLRTITKADKIFIVDNGRVLDSGTHNELVSRCEKYRVDVVHQSLE